MPIAVTNVRPVSVAEPASKPAGSRARLWTGRAFSTLAVLFMLLDAAGKFAMPAPVIDAFRRLGFPVSLGPSLGVLLLVCTLAYAIPRTAVLGALLLTGFFGGAVAIQMRAGSTLFETIFPILLGVVTWAGIYLRDSRLANLLPVRCLG